MKANLSRQSALRSPSTAPRKPDETVKVAPEPRSSKPEQARAKAPSVRPTSVEGEFARDLYVPPAGTVAPLDVAAPVQAAHVATRSSPYGELFEVEAPSASALGERRQSFEAEVERELAEIRTLVTSDMHERLTSVTRDLLRMPEDGA